MKTVFLLSLQFIMNITICSTNDKIIKVSLASKYGLFIVFIIVPNIKSLSRKPLSDNKLFLYLYPVQVIYTHAKIDLVILMSQK